FMLLIENQQEDNIGRKSKTALIVKGYKNTTLEFGKVLTLFWTRTNRNSSNSDLLAKQCDHIFGIIKKKKNKRWWLLPLALISLSIILVFLFQKLSKG
ncbi:hypothetical protein CVD09_19580, partial [Acinetobacter seifertii]